MNNNIIDLDDAIDFSTNNICGSTNIPYDKLISNHKQFLDKNKCYKLVCKKGNKSKKAAAILKIYGYDVTYISK